MSDTQHIPLPAPKEPELRCSIDLSNRGIWIHWEPALPDGPHKVSPVEIMAAGALIGIGRTLTGQGAADVIEALTKFDKASRRKATGRR